MKTLITGIVLLVACASCTQVASYSGKNSDSTQSQATTQVYRDESINQSNAYSDRFLDSNSIEHFISEKHLPDSTASMLRNFYLARNYEFAWFSGDGITEQARSLWSLYSSVRDSSRSGDKSLEKKMDSLVQNDSLALSDADSSLIQSELSLTGELLKYAAAHPGNGISNQTIYYLVPAKRMDAMQLADSLLNKQKDSSAYAGNIFYSRLRSQLAHYYSIAKNGGWQAIQLPGNVIKKGNNAPLISAVKKRLQATGEYMASDTSRIFTDSLVSAIKNWQQHNGFRPDGNISDSMIKVMNIPAEQRIRQILVNMNRSLWMQPSVEPDRIVVNIPSFMLYVYEGGTANFEMPVIVGKEGTGTVMFTGNINEIVFNPAWNLPESIVKNEIMPALSTDKSYLRKHHMEIVKANDSLPTIRQLPGKDNALGRVKFLFPNSFDIYLHDTPDKSAFASSNRAMSHGCIRVADAEKLAVYLLRDQQEWNGQKVHAAIESGREQKVTVKASEPVFITYYTTWVDDHGAMNFRPDVYGHDEEAENSMFEMGG